MFFNTLSLELSGQSRPVESKSKWPRGQISWPRAYGPVLMTSLSRVGMSGEGWVPTCQTWNLGYPPPPLLTGGTHHTGMLSCIPVCSFQNNCS